MTRVLLLVLVCLSESYAFSVNELVGNWTAVTHATTNGTKTVEREILTLNANHTFSIIIFVSLQKGDAFIKDLRVEGSGIWKHRDNTLVVVIKNVKVPFAKEIYLISQESLRVLANSFKQKYENEPIRISIIKHMEANKMTTLSEKLQETTYLRH